MNDTRSFGSDLANWALGALAGGQGTVVGLKAAGEIDWPWVWVLAPSWIQLALISAGGVLFLLLEAASG